MTPITVTFQPERPVVTHLAVLPVLVKRDTKAQEPQDHAKV